MPSSPSIRIEPRLLTASALARYLGRSPSWFYSHEAELRKKGFPDRIRSMNAWDKSAVDAWLDRQSGLLPASDAQPASKPWRPLDAH